MHLASMRASRIRNHCSVSGFSVVAGQKLARPPYWQSISPRDQSSVNEPSKMPCKSDMPSQRGQTNSQLILEAFHSAEFKRIASISSNIGSSEGTCRKRGCPLRRALATTPSLARPTCPGQLADTVVRPACKYGISMLAPSHVGARQTLRAEDAAGLALGPPALSTESGPKHQNMETCGNDCVSRDGVAFACAHESELLK